MLKWSQQVVIPWHGGAQPYAATHPAPGVPRRSYRPAQRSCPSCQSTLKRSHILWRKRLITLTGPVQVISWGYRCPKATCASAAVVYRSVAAEGLHLRKHQFSREVIVQVGYRRFWYHQTIYEIHAWLTQDLGLAVSERQVANLIADFLALLQAAQPAKVRATLQPLKYLVVGLDGMQPAKGDTCLYIVRELQTDVTLCAENLDDSADATIRTRLLQPLKALARNSGCPGMASSAMPRTPFARRCVPNWRVCPPGLPESLSPGSRGADLSSRPNHEKAVEGFLS